MNDNNNTPLVAVFDIGKTNVKLNVVTPQGEVLETLSTPNPSVDGPPYRHHDLSTLEEWLLTNLAALSRRHRLNTFVACGHGSGCVLVDDDGPSGPHDRLRTAASPIYRTRLRPSRRPLP